MACFDGMCGGCEKCLTLQGRWPEDDDDEGLCQRCGGEGLIVTCVDDLCHGAGECIHGDGMSSCPACDGTGERA